MNRGFLDEAQKAAENGDSPYARAILLDVVSGMVRRKKKGLPVEDSDRVRCIEVFDILLSKTQPKSSPKPQCPSSKNLRIRLQETFSGRGDSED